MTLDTAKQPSTKAVHVRVPVRMDLAGGTLDIWPICHALQKPCTVNLAINLWAEVWLEPIDSPVFELQSEDQSLQENFQPSDAPLTSKLPLLALALQKSLPNKLYEQGGLRLRTKALSPAGAGLGGSSALLAAILTAIEVWEGKHQDNELSVTSSEFKDSIAAKARDIESALIHTPTGVQDYLGALYGGLNVIDYIPGGWKVHNYSQEPWLHDFAECLVVYFSGQSRASAINNWEMFKAFYNQDAKTVQSFADLASLSREVAAACQGQNYLQLLEASKKEWNKRLDIWPAIHSEQTLILSEFAAEHGATLSRVFGAGGGGVMASFCQSAKEAKGFRAAMEPKLAEVGGRFLDAGLNLNVDGGSGVQVNASGLV